MEVLCLCSPGGLFKHSISLLMWWREKRWLGAWFYGTNCILGRPGMVGCSITLWLIFKCQRKKEKKIGLIPKFRNYSVDEIPCLFQVGHLKKLGRNICFQTWTEIRLRLMVQFIFFSPETLQSLKTYRHQLEKVPNLNCSRILKTENVVLIYIKNLLMITKSEAEK